ncbi:hypothetical protein TNCV_3957841 [Trichonephila clavipes]|nr:hypothetical protein TNCV_3957841 [Trichonephila clavipes]
MPPSDGKRKSEENVPLIAREDVFISSIDITIVHLNKRGSDLKVFLRLSDGEERSKKAGARGEGQPQRILIQIDLLDVLRGNKVGFGRGWSRCALYPEEFDDVLGVWTGKSACCVGVADLTGMLRCTKKET